MECNCDKLSRMCIAHKPPLGGMISRVLCYIVHCDHLHVIYVEFLIFVLVQVILAILYVLLSNYEQHTLESLSFAYVCNIGRFL